MEKMAGQKPIITKAKKINCNFQNPWWLSCGMQGNLKKRSNVYLPRSSY
jgi:ribosomal protein L5